MKRFLLFMMGIGVAVTIFLASAGFLATMGPSPPPVAHGTFPVSLPRKAPYELSVRTELSLLILVAGLTAALVLRLRDFQRLAEKRMAARAQMSVEEMLVEARRLAEPRLPRERMAVVPLSDDGQCPDCHRPLRDGCAYCLFCGCGF